MTTLLAAAWVMTVIHFTAYFAALSATATLTLFSGFRVLRRKRPDIDPHQRARALDRAVTLAVLAIGGWVAFLAVTGRTGRNGPVAMALINLSKVSEAKPLSDGSWRLSLASGAEVVTSRTYRDALLDRLGRKIADGQAASISSE